MVRRNRSPADQLCNTNIYAFVEKCSDSMWYLDGLTVAGPQRKPIFFDKLPTPSHMQTALEPLPSSHRLSARRKQIVLIPQVLAAVGLPKRHDARRVQTPRLARAAGGDAEAQGRVVHAVHDDALVLRAVVGPPPHVRLDDVAAVQEGHLAVGLDPDLVPGVFGQDGQRGDVQPELARLCKLAEADAERGELFALCRGKLVSKSGVAFCRCAGNREELVEGRRNAPIDTARLAMESLT